MSEDGHDSDAILPVVRGLKSKHSFWTLPGKLRKSAGKPHRQQLTAATFVDPHHRSDKDNGAQGGTLLAVSAQAPVLPSFDELHPRPRAQTLRATAVVPRTDQVQHASKTSKKTEQKNHKSAKKLTEMFTVERAKLKGLEETDDVQDDKDQKASRFKSLTRRLSRSRISQESDRPGRVSLEDLPVLSRVPAKQPKRPLLSGVFTSNKKHQDVSDRSSYNISQPLSFSEVKTRTRSQSDTPLEALSLDFDTDITGTGVTAFSDPIFSACLPIPPSPSPSVSSSPGSVNDQKPVKAEIDQDSLPPEPVKPKLRPSLAPSSDPQIETAFLACPHHDEYVPITKALQVTEKLSPFDPVQCAYTFNHIAKSHEYDVRLSVTDTGPRQIIRHLSNGTAVSENPPLLQASPHDFGKLGLEKITYITAQQDLRVAQSHAPGTLVLPVGLAFCLRFLLEEGCGKPGIFRVNGSVRTIKTLIDGLQGLSVESDYESSSWRKTASTASIHDVAGVFKQVISVLDGGLFGRNTISSSLLSLAMQYDEVDPMLRRNSDGLPSGVHGTLLTMIASGIGALRADSRRMLVFATFCLLSSINERTHALRTAGTHADTSQLMDAQSLGIIFGPLIAGNLGHKTQPYAKQATRLGSDASLRSLTSSSSDVHEVRDAYADVARSSRLTHIMIENWTEIVGVLKRLTLPTQHPLALQKSFSGFSTSEPSVVSDGFAAGFRSTFGSYDNAGSALALPSPEHEIDAHRPLCQKANSADQRHAFRSFLAWEEVTEELQDNVGDFDLQRPDSASSGQLRGSIVCTPEHFKSVPIYSTSLRRVPTEMNLHQGETALVQNIQPRPSILKTLSQAPPTNFFDRAPSGDITTLSEMPMSNSLSHLSFEHQALVGDIASSLTLGSSSNASIFKRAGSKIFPSDRLPSTVAEPPVSGLKSLQLLAKSLEEQNKHTSTLTRCKDVLVDRLKAAEAVIGKLNADDHVGIANSLRSYEQTRLQSAETMLELGLTSQLDGEVNSIVESDDLIKHSKVEVSQENTKPQRDYLQSSFFSENRNSLGRLDWTY